MQFAHLAKQGAIMQSVCELRWGGPLELTVSWLRPGSAGSMSLRASFAV